LEQEEEDARLLSEARQPRKRISLTERLKKQPAVLNSKTTDELVPSGSPPPLLFDDHRFDDARELMQPYHSTVSNFDTDETQPYQMTVSQFDMVEIIPDHSTVSKSDTDEIQPYHSTGSNEQSQPDHNLIRLDDLIRLNDTVDDTVGVLENDLNRIKSTRKKGSAKLKLYSFISENKVVAGTFPSLSRTLDIPIASLKRAVYDLDAIGAIFKDTKDGNGGGFVIRLNTQPDHNLIRLNLQGLRAEPYQDLIRLGDISSIKKNITTKSENNIEDESKILAHFASFSNEKFSKRYPNIFKCGFNYKNLKQLLKDRTELKESIAGIPCGLDHIEWILENETLKDSKGRVVENPCGFIFQHLLKSGYFKRPDNPGYKSPEEQRIQDKLMEEKSISETREALDAIELSKWMAGLTGDAKDYFLNNSGFTCTEPFSKSPRFRDLALKAAWRRLKNGEINDHQGNGEPGASEECEDGS